MKKRRFAMMVLSLSLVLIGCSRAPANALDLIDRDVDWKKLDAVQLQFEQTYVDIEDVKGLREMLNDVILNGEPEPASKGWTFALKFDKRNQSVLTLSKYSEKRFHIVYRDLEYTVKEHGPELFEYLLQIFQQQGIKIQTN